MRRYVAVLLACMTGVFMLGGCGGASSGGASSQASTQESAPAAEETTEEATEEASEETAEEASTETTQEEAADATEGESAEEAASEEEIPEIYTMVDAISMAGLSSPYISDRSSIEKAWPKTPADPDHIVIGWAEHSMSNPWFVDVASAADAAAEKYGYEIKRLVCDMDPIKQSEHFDTFISQGVDIIAVNPADMMAVVADVERAVAAGIPVVGAAGIITEETAPLLTSVVSSPWECGFEAGKYIADQYDASEDLIAACIIGVLGNPTSEGRVNGMVTGILYNRLKANGDTSSDAELYLKAYDFYQEVIKNGHAEMEEANFSIVSQLPGEWTEEGGMSGAEDIITSHPEVSLIIAENDWMGMGALKAIANAGRTGDIQVGCCADGIAEAVKMVQDGEMLSTGGNSAVQQGEEVVEFIHKIFNGEVDPTNLPITSYFPAVAITGDNVDKYYDENETYFKYDPMEFLSVPEFIESLE